MVGQATTDAGTINPARNPWTARVKTPTGGGTPPQDPTRLPTVWRDGTRALALVTVLSLTVLADVLFWDHNLGISVAIFAMALAASVLAFKPGGASPRDWAIGMGGTLLFNLPVIEQVQFFSMLFTFTGTIGLLAWTVHGKLVSGWQSFVTFLRASTLGLILFPVAVSDEIRQAKLQGSWATHIKALILPGIVGAVFLMLFAAANPVLDRFLVDAFDFDGFSEEQMVRALFWALVLCAAWPYLNTSALRRAPRKAAKTQAKSAPRAKLGLLTPMSVRNSLFLFNAMFLVQTVMDISVLSGGMALPEGITYARYAHSGAYPLVATAFLAGIFAIASHKMIEGNSVLRGLMYLWLAQNMVLVITAAIRLGIYIDAYHLTYLRVAALIWMGLVFVALSLIIAYMAQHRPLAWLVRWNMCVLGLTLYACCFVNFAHIIAEYNLAQLGTTDLDTWYICNLGEGAIPAILEAEMRREGPVCRYGEQYLRQQYIIEGWQDWGFRRWRLEQYLAERNIIEGAFLAIPYPDYR